jgi:acyl-CoA synthetase (AMP-forming)/AMP-acid ligase II/thioesterase domain-containing protein
MDAFQCSPGMQGRNVPSDFTIRGLLAEQAGLRPTAVAIAAPGRRPLTFGRLLERIDQVVATLNGLGIGRGDRVAVVLPNGPEMAVSFLAVASAAACAPLNPAYRANEFDFYLSDLRARALVIWSDLESPARAVAQAGGIPIIELVPSVEAEAGLFTLKGEGRAQPGQPGFAQPQDVALVLHTSGTTSRPKIVPLTQTNLRTSAHNIQATLHLDKSDRCLNVMPLFHIHGLMAATLASLAAGASVVGTPGFYAPKFFDWLGAFRPTWYTAVPTMHQAILARAPAHRDVITRCPLRFLRSSSSALSPQLLAELEQVFQAPVIEAYGMTEASHQMASNPLPPLARKPGSVGKAAGPEIAIMDEAGRLLPQGQTGEIVIRGANVTPGYENNPQANQSAFTEGWFRTGDQGHLDAAGYLFLTGRIKELINRGGEKIAPREVDEALLDHPAVAQAIAFAVPHAKLGEDVAAAVVLRPGATAEEKELQVFAALRLADFKVPRRVLILEEIPKGPTGKPQRIGLAEKLGLTTTEVEPVEVKECLAQPRTATEKALVQIWKQLLRIEQVGVRDDFFQIGGDSVLAAALFAEIQKTLGPNLPMATLLQGATIEHLGQVIDQQASSWPAVVKLQTAGSGPPFFCVHGVGGEIMDMSLLAQQMAPDQPFYGFQMPGWNGVQRQFNSLEAMAAHYVEELRTAQPEGPYYLGGYSFGGCVAFEMAQQLHAHGERIALLAILDDTPPPVRKGKVPWWSPAFLFEFLKNTPNWFRDEFFQPGAVGGFAQVWMKMRRARRRLGALFTKRVGKFTNIEAMFDSSQLPECFRLTVEANHTLYLDYVPKPYPGRVTLFRARTRPLLHLHGPDLGWKPLAAGGLEITVIPGNHETILREPYVQVFARRLKACIRKAHLTHGSTRAPAESSSYSTVGGMPVVP